MYKCGSVFRGQRSLLNLCDLNITWIPIFILIRIFSIFSTSIKFHYFIFFCNFWFRIVSSTKANNIITKRSWKGESHIHTHACLCIVLNMYKCLLCNFCLHLSTNQSKDLSIYWSLDLLPYLVISAMFIRLNKQQTKRQQIKNGAKEERKVNQNNVVNYSSYSKL